MRDRQIAIGKGRLVKVTPVFDTYWRFAAKRQDIFHRRVQGEPPPWTDDPVLSSHRFTNVYRASDRVSQYLIRHVIYDGASREEDIFFRVVLFKLFNRIETWTELTREIGPIMWSGYSRMKYERVLDSVMEAGKRVYSAAYIMPSPDFGAQRKHANHLRLIEEMMAQRLPIRLSRSKSLEEAYRLLLGCRSLGPFLAFQLAIDLNYSPLLSFSEMDYVVAGPGARSGLRKCFVDNGGFSNEDLIRGMAEIADSEFSRLGLNFRNLWGRSLQLIDCQNLFCEVDKYARVVHPEFAGAGRTKIKQKYFPSHTDTLPQWYPPKWKITPTAAAGHRAPQLTLAWPRM